MIVQITVDDAMQDVVNTYNEKNKTEHTVTSFIQIMVDRSVKGFLAQAEDVERRNFFAAYKRLPKARRAQMVKDLGIVNGRLE